MKSWRKLNWLPESLLLFLTSAMSSLSVPRISGKEPSTNSVNTLDALPAHQQDGFQVLLPIKSPKSSNNPESWLLLTLNQIDKPSLKLHMLTFPPLLSATQTLLLISLMLLSHAEIEKQNPLPWFSGSLQEKFWSWEVKFQKIPNGKKWLIFSLPEISNQSEPNKKKPKKNKKNLKDKTNKQKFKLNNQLLLKENKAGDYLSPLLTYQFTNINLMIKNT